MKEEKKIFVEMLLGIAISSTIISVIGSIFASPWFTFTLGTLLGAAVASVALIHLYNSINRAIDMDEKSAQKKIQKTAPLRVMFMGLALVIGILLPGIFNILGILLGVMALKFAAYLQPLIHKIMASKI